MFKRSGVAFSFLIVILLALLLYLNREELSVNQVKPAEQKPLWQLSFAHNTPENSALHQGAVRFKELVEARANGNIELTLYPAQQLGNDHQMVEMARHGEIDIILTPTAKMSVPVPSMQYADLPFYFPSRDDLYHLLDGDVGALLLQDLNTIGLVGVTFWENGFKHFTSNFPITGPDDFNTKNIRVMKSRMLMSQFEALGASPIAIDFHKIKPALESGVVDGQENPLVAIYTMGLHEVQSHLTLSEHGYLGYVFSISAKTFSRLPVELRNLLVDTAREVTQWERQETQRREAELLAKIAESGITVSTLSAEQKQAFATRLAFIPVEYEHIIGANILALSQRYINQKYADKSNPSQGYIIGLNLDLSQNNQASSLAIKRGVEFAVAELNKLSTNPNSNIQLVTLDHRDSLKTSRNNLQKLLSYDNIALIVGGRESDPDIYGLDITTRTDVLYLLPRHAYPTLVSDQDKTNNVIQLHYDETPTIRFIVERALSRAKRPLILFEKSPRGEYFKAIILSILAEHGITDPVMLALNSYQIAPNSIVDKVRTENVDVIISALNAHELMSNINHLGGLSSSLPIFSVENLAPSLAFIKQSDLPDNLPIFYAAEVDIAQGERKEHSINGNQVMTESIFDLAQGQEDLLHTYAIVKNIGHSLLLESQALALSDSDAAVKQLVSLEHATKQHKNGVEFRLYRVVADGTKEAQTQ